MTAAARHVHGGSGSPSGDRDRDARERFFAAKGAGGGADLSVSLGGLRLSNPVMPASGCFGPELAPLLPMGELGAVVTKTVFALRRGGNAAHRLTETPMGMINSVGIPSPGTRGFVQDVLPRYRATGRPVVVSVGGLRIDEYLRVADELAGVGCAAFEVNVSCPNLEHGGIEIGASPEAVHRVTDGVRRRLGDVPVWVKLTPMAPDIAAVADAAQSAGARALTVANSFPGMVVSSGDGTPVLGNGVGGVSGPAIKPLVLRLVWLVARSVSIPVIGCGGIGSAQDVLDHLRVGATAVQVGTATFARPQVMAEIVRELEALCARAGVATLQGLVHAGRHADAVSGPAGTPDEARARRDDMPTRQASPRERMAEHAGSHSRPTSDQDVVDEPAGDDLAAAP
ncbi:dihydroorotate dehydrogenase [Actinomadura viridis]|uniref:Dihydroorotate dehydrogenase n=1 Tax=Actinomadura viridis TaxID=58110 RepID=A0A931DNH4_9ACTN|nr:dihydroorotate dehydrogenase [Actinomadura viridis]MBG6091798.1 dihydroorotate dehydrogenase (NAD+) catalytic subunit [Actinomadura viridis]